MAQNMRKTITGYFKGYDEAADLVRFVATTSAVDREGESISAEGWKLDNFIKNPVMLWSHDAHQLPIGKVAKIYPDGDSLIAEVQFAEKESAFAKTVADLVKGGFLNAVSVGFMPLAYDGQGKMVSQELLELSVVNVPANQEALRSNEYQAFVKSLDLEETKELKLKATETTTETKSPACRQEGESRDECVARKIPEIKREYPDKTQEQCVGMAEGICDTACEVDENEGEQMKSDDPYPITEPPVTEQNRNSIRIAIDAMNAANEALSNILKQSEPPVKKGEEQITIEQQTTTREKRMYSAARLMDKVAEALIHELKNGGEKI